MNLKTHLENARQAVNDKSLRAVTAVGATVATTTAAASGGGGGGTTIPGSDGMSDAFSTLQTEAGSMIDSAWPVLIAITGGLILMKLGKKVMNRAT
ncbi:major coat protein [uncultured Halovibrio sp.]|uniref:major coat protein n=1 Tax=uncultured Halovibrio sp. TaxID=985049 RepID=UPI0025D6505A|nr:major coat protein [uncultured Halovibrio sp.]